MKYVQNIFVSNISVCSKFSSVHSSHSLCAHTCVHLTPPPQPPLPPTTTIYSFIGRKRNDNTHLRYKVH